MGLNILLIDLLTREEILISKKVTVKTLLPENLNSTSKRIFNISAKNSHAIEIKHDHSSTNHVNNQPINSKFKRPRLDNKVIITPPRPEQRNSTSINENLVWSVMNIENTKEIKDENGTNGLNLFFDTFHNLNK